MCRCFPHIINICCQHITAEFTDAALVDVETFETKPPHGTLEAQSFDDAVQRDPIALGRVVVRSIRSSGQRREKFTAVIQDGNAQKHFILGDCVEIVVPELQLLHDVKTRWDSIFFIISHLRIMRPVCGIAVFVLRWTEYLAGCRSFFGPACQQRLDAPSS
jgi:hypothetical protein